MMDDDIPQEELTEVLCPICNEKMYYIQMMTDIAFERQILIQTYFCKKCLYKKNEIVTMNRGEPIRARLLIRNMDDLRTVVYRSPEARIFIPEIDAEISPGETSTGEVTTVEGIITRTWERMFSAMEEFEGTEEEFEKATRKMETIIKWRFFPFTFMLEDPSGMSRIQSSRAAIEKIDQEEK
jgi:ZPR1-related zinc finger protein